MVNGYNRGQDIYPTSMTQAYNMIVNHVEPTKTRYNGSHAPPPKQESDSESEDNVAFLQKGAEHITCFDCGEMGHYKNSVECKNPKKKNGAQILITNGAGIESDSESDTLSWNMVNYGINMTNASDRKNLTTVQLEVARQGKISKYWILLDSESTIDIVCDEGLLTKIRKVDKGKEIRCFYERWFSRLGYDWRSTRIRYCMV